jgi:uncharacterized damage-inducible protein DinB
MIHSIDEFLRYFDGVQRRTLRDIAALPKAADDWAPPASEGEQAWSVNQIIAHIAAARMFFANAYLGRGWRFPPFPDTGSRDRWVPMLEASAAEFRGTLTGTPDEWLSRRVPLADEPGDISGWRILLMLIEHEVHHRSQLDTWSGLNGWNPPQIFGRRWEEIAGSDE